MKRLLLVLGILLLAGFGYQFYLIVTAEQRVRALCEQITPGMPFAELKTFAAEHGLLPPVHESGVNLLIEERSYGRWGCRVVVAEGMVQQSAFHYSD
jgi:hypothetical protein